MPTNYLVAGLKPLESKTPGKVPRLSAPEHRFEPLPVVGSHWEPANASNVFARLDTNEGLSVSVLHCNRDWPYYIQVGFRRQEWRTEEGWQRL